MARAAPRSLATPRTNLGCGWSEEGETKEEPLNQRGNAWNIHAKYLENPWKPMNICGKSMEIYGKSLEIPWGKSKGNRGKSIGNPWKSINLHVEVRDSPAHMKTTHLRTGSQTHLRTGKETHAHRMATHPRTGGHLSEFMRVQPWGFEIRGTGGGNRGTGEPGNSRTGKGSWEKTNL